MAIDPAAVARIKAALDLDHDEATIAAALKASTPALNLRLVAAEVIRSNPWNANGAGRWRLTRPDGRLQLLAGMPPGIMAEMSDNGDGNVTCFLYSVNPAVDPNTFVGSPIDGMSAFESKVRPIPGTMNAAYVYLESAVTGGHLP